MSKDYTPLSGRVEAVYVGYTEDHGFDSREEAEKQFRRYEKQIKADAWDEGADALEHHQMHVSGGWPTNPYREQEEA